MGAEDQTIVRFGLFEVDLQSGELRKGGIKIRLQEQPFQVLAMLLERPGQVVTREELRARLWPADTFVDFDHSLNTAINKVREALSDSAGNPRFVETLARRGYRFIAPVQSEIRASVAAAAVTEPAANPVTAAPQPTTAPAPLLPPQDEVPKPRREVPRILLAVVQVMYLAFYLASLGRLGEVDRLGNAALGGQGWVLLVLVVLTAVLGIPMRLYILSAVSFDYRRLGEKFPRLFPFILPLDLLWALAPFLLIEQIGFGLAFAATAALLYLPFSQRTLVRMAY